MENNEMISVIVPVYKVEKYLNECVESIINQTYKNLEIILVDDGSPDKCPQICDEYAKKDKRIKVIHKENAGVSAARNTALDIMTGKYVVFLDSDDYFELDTIEKLYKELKETDADISGANTYDFFEEDKSSRRMSKKQGFFEFTDDEKFKAFFSEKYFATVIWGRLYKWEHIKDIRFDPAVGYGEDYKVFYELLKRAKKLTINNNRVSVNYRIRGDSILHSGYSKKGEGEIQLSKDVLEDIKKNYPHLEKYAIGRLQRSVTRLLANYFKTYKELKGAKHLFDAIEEYPNCMDLETYIKYFSLKYLSFPVKMYFKLRGKM